MIPTGKWPSTRVLAKLTFRYDVPYQNCMETAMFQLKYYPVLIRYFLFLTLFTSLISCSRYEFSINDRVVYTPPPLFSGFSISDPFLRTCVKSAIAEENVTRADQLQRLLCPPGAINSLDGIEIFTNLNQLGLAENNVASIAQLTELDELRHLNLKGNDNLLCKDLDQLKKVEAIEVPSHCQPNIEKD